MTQTDDIDLLLTLNPHGWSTCFLIVDGKTVELTITHIFSATTDPYIELIQALTNLINGHNSVTFFWHGEPGGEKIEISRIATQQNKVLVKVDGFGGDFTEEPKEYEPTIHFEVKLKQLIILFYLQLKKTAMLLQDPQFAHNRANDFPMQDYMKFEILANQYLVS